MEEPQVKVSQILMAAKDRLVFGNWGQGYWYQRPGIETGDLGLGTIPAEFDERDTFCAEGAIASAIAMKFGFIETSSLGCALQNHVEHVFMEGAGLKRDYASVNICISSWNDQADRTEQQVFDAFDEAIAYAKDLEDKGEL